MFTGSVPRRGTPCQGPKLGSCLTLGNELSEETHVLTKQDFIWKGHLGGEQEGKGTQEDCFAMWLTVSGFMVMGLVSRFSLANHLTQGPSWWHTHCSAEMQEGFWEVVGHVASPFDLS